ncbi:AT-hook motif nuclear-localized protein 1-like protein [Drosera capensis]
MEAKENMFSGIAVMRAEASSEYHAKHHTEASGQATLTPSMSLIPGDGGLLGVMNKKKRGRPRKYAPDGTVTIASSTRPISASAPAASSKFSTGKQGRARPIGTEIAVERRIEKCAGGGGAMHWDGSHFTPHVITVDAGEDVTAKIISFCQHGPRAICILSANGIISNATLRQSDSSGSTLTYEGRFEIVNLCGSVTPAEREGVRDRAGGLSVSLSTPNGQVVGGCIAGLMVAASPVQIIVGSFLPSNIFEHKPKKPKPQPAQVSVMASAGSVKAEQLNRHEQNNKGATTQNVSSSSAFQKESWPVQYKNNGLSSRQSTTDINIPLR